MKMLPWAGPLLDSETFGRYLTMSSNVVTDNWLSVSLLIAWMVIGTFWMLSERRCAVTTMSAISSVSDGAASATPAWAPSTAMIAHVSL